jgi:hypothetical protein
MIYLICKVHFNKEKVNFNKNISKRKLDYSKPKWNAYGIKIIDITPGIANHPLLV